ncbi:MAG TPA: TIGR03013 family XrtA/PEP-CTERM system glycosyltransferase [Steroidobacteraceae bacterium]|jgi:sugar transferase (PEP-CTERM system associated)|nr:TIGR03013 family XrtA/PEP-CTERM system glycosyltransferase [Steroidobacteraceae bacterium]
MRVRLLGHYVHLSIAAMAAVDAIIFSCAMLLAYRTRFHTWYPVPSIGSDKALWLCAVVFTAVNLLSVLGFGLYSSRQRARTGGVFVRLIAACAAATAATALLFYFIPSLYIGRGVLALALVFSLLGVGAAHGVFSRMMDESLLKRRVLVYGVGQRTTAISSLRRRSDRRGFEIVGYVQPDGESIAVSPERVLDASEGILTLCTRLDVQEIVVAMEDRRRGFPILGLLECRLAGVEVTELLTFLERETGRVRIDVLNPSWMIFGEGFRRDPVRLFSSRALDLVASVLLLILSLPFMLITMVAIKLEDGWRAPVFYGQARVGLAGQPFKVLKFRSMRTDAERDGQAQWAQKSDPRVTRVGAVIRKLRIDELPQILNVVTGQMSFVGPRPERPQFVAELAQKIPYYVQRHCVKPGITGWAQLCYPYGSSEEDALEKLQYDLYYIKNNTLLFDLAILVQTAEVVFMGKGAR